MKKWLSLFFASVICLSLVACGGDSPPSADPATPPDLSGEWVQTNSSSDDSYQAAYISDGVIEIYWVLEDMTALYWAGSFTAPTSADEPYTWSSTNDTTKTGSAMMASGDATKDFTYEDGVISYTASALGSTGTIELEKQSWGYADLELSLGGGGEVMAGSGDLGDYHVSIKGASLTKDHDGNPVIVVTYDWTNNSSETTSAMVAVIEQAFQDGIELDTAFIIDDSYESIDNSMTDVRPGTTLEIQCAFVLTSETSMVEFELSEFISLSGSLVTAEFDPSAL